MLVLQHDEATEYKLSTDCTIQYTH